MSRHRARAQNPTTIVAVEEDPEVPIFEFADCLVGELFIVLPQAPDEVTERNG